MVFGIFKKNQFEKDYRKAFIVFVKSINLMYNSFKSLKDDFKKEHLDELNIKVLAVEENMKNTKLKLDECLKNVNWSETKKIKLHLQFNEIEKERTRLDKIKESIKKCYDYLELEKKQLSLNEVSKNE